MHTYVKTTNGIRLRNVVAYGIVLYISRSTAVHLQSLGQSRPPQFGGPVAVPARGSVSLCMYVNYVPCGGRRPPQQVRHSAAGGCPRRRIHEVSD